MALLDEFTAALSSMPKCGENDLLKKIQEAQDEMNNKISEALNDINGKIDDAIGEIEAGIAAAQDALNGALSSIKIPRDMRTDFQLLLAKALNPLSQASGDFQKSLDEFREYYKDAVDDIDEIIGKISSFLNDPIGSLESLCDSIPNVKEGPDGKPALKNEESTQPSADAEPVIVEKTQPEVVTQRENIYFGTAEPAPTLYPETAPPKTPAPTGSGSVTLAHLTTGNRIPYTVQKQSDIYGLSVAQITDNLERLADEVMSPIKDAFPDLVITHGFRSEHVELKSGSYVPRRNKGSSDHYRGCACDFTFTNVKSKDELIARANQIRSIVPEFRQFILEYPGRYQNNQYLLHIAYDIADNKNQVLTMVSKGNTITNEFV